MNICMCICMYVHMYDVIHVSIQVCSTCFDRQRLCQHFEIVLNEYRKLQSNIKANNIKFNW